VTECFTRFSFQGETAVYLLPFAGGSASSYWQWAQSFPVDVQVSAAQLPGRQDRWREEYYTGMPTLVADLADEIAADLHGRRYVLFGHSMGATMAFELARELRRRGVPEPALLAVSAMSAPHQPRDVEPVCGQSDDELAAATCRGGGLPDQILHNPELLELVVPTLRADLELIDAYEHIPGEPLTCPIVVFGGTDDQLVPSGALAGWHELTLATTTVRTFPGNHFYLWEHEQEIASVITAALRADAPERTPLSTTAA